jgi:hypothetical protein
MHIVRGVKFRINIVWNVRINVVIVIEKDKNILLYLVIINIAKNVYKICLFTKYRFALI